MLDSKCNSAAKLALTRNLAHFTSLSFSARPQLALPVIDPEPGFPLSQNYERQHEFINKIHQKSAKVDLVKVLELLDFPNADFGVLITGCHTKIPKHFAKYLKTKLRQVEQLEEDDHRLYLEWMLRSSLKVLEVRDDPEKSAYAQHLYQHLLRARILNFANNMQPFLKSDFVKSAENQQTQISQMKRQTIHRLSLWNKKADKSKVSIFYSKALSKYVLQNVMEFLYWKTDSTKVRSICKKFKIAWDMHLVNLAQSMQINLHDNYNADEIREGERLLSSFVAKMSSNARGNTTIEGFCIDIFHRLNVLSSNLNSITGEHLPRFEEQNLEPMAQILTLRKENHYMYALCMNAILSVFSDQRSYKLKPYHLDYASHLRSLKYFGDKPAFANILSTTTDVLLHNLPLGRLQYFLRFVDRFGPTLEEVVNFIKTKLLVKIQRPQNQAAEVNKELMMLSAEQLIRLILISKTHASVDAVEDLKLVRFTIEYRLNCKDDELAILLGYLHLHRYANGLQELQQQKQLISLLIQRNNLVPSELDQIKRLIKIFKLSANKN